MDPFLPHRHSRVFTPVRFLLLWILATSPSALAQYNAFHLMSKVTNGTFLWASGSNFLGQLADRGSSSSTPADVIGISGVTAVGNAGSHARHACVIISGTIKCWGQNSNGELGYGVVTSVQSAVTVTGISTATAVAMGPGFTCAVLGSGTVRCWGRGPEGQLGYGASPTRQVAPTQVTGITSATKISAGLNFACAVLASGSVQCWGNNSRGQLGNGTNTNSNVPVTVQGITTAIDVDAGANSTNASTGGGHACALLSSGEVWCWGAGTFGELGNGAALDSNIPVKATGITTATQISMGILFSCARLSDGTVWCWGSGTNYRTGLGSGTNRTSPTQLTGITTATQVTALFNVAIARLSDGSYRCWGTPTRQECPPDNVQRISPSATTPGTYTEIFGSYYHMCGRKADDTIACWGEVGYGQQGNGYFNDGWLEGRVYQRTSALSGVVDLSLGSWAGCAVLSSGSVRCWGDNGTGALGDGTINSSFTPVTVSGITNATKVKVSYGADGGRTFACALLADRSLKCWGYSASTLGIANGYTSNQTSPVSIGGITTATDLGLGYHHACVLLSSGAIQCWGYGNLGNLGRGSTTNSATPVAVSGISTATALASGGHSNCALLADTTVRCWGQNNVGQMGDGTTTQRNTSVAVSGLTGATAISCSISHCCARLSDGSMQCWGAGTQGQLGNNAFTNQWTPVAVTTSTGMTNVSKISANGLNTAAITSDGQLWVWGEGANFALGRANQTDLATPLSRGGNWSLVAVGLYGIMAYPAP